MTRMLAPIVAYTTINAERVVGGLLGGVRPTAPVKQGLFASGFLMVVVLFLALPCSAAPNQMDTRAWGLPELVDHLHARGLRLHVVPTRASGEWGNSIYLTEDPQTTWYSFQGKRRNLTSVAQWQGAVWVERLHAKG